MKEKFLKLLLLSVLITSTLSAKQTQSEISMLYVALFNRASEGSGNQFWQGIDSSMEEIAKEMLDSSDAINYFGSSLNSNQSFIEHIYLNTLNKTASTDPKGIEYWVRLLDRGISRGKVVSDLLNATTSGDFGGDTKALEAQAQFYNRVEVSNYMANHVQNLPFDYTTSTSFGSGLKVTSNIATVESAKKVIDNLAIIDKSFGYSKIYNYYKSVASIVGVYYRLDANASWGDNLIPQELDAGYNFDANFKSSPCNHTYQVKAVYKNGKNQVRDVYLACNKTEDIWFWLYQSSISSENIDCSTKGKNRMLYDIMKDRYLWYEHTPNLDYESYSSLDRLLDDLKYKTYDRWSFLISTEESENYFSLGKYGGIGYRLFYSNGKLYVAFAYKNSPAYKLGLVRGVEILEINGKTVQEIVDGNLWASITGQDEIGVGVNLRVNIGGNINDITLIKDTVYINSVLYDDILNVDDKKIGYLVFNTFIEPSKEELDEVFSKFKKENIDELILDLRYNGGGVLKIGEYLASLIGGEYTAGNIFETLQHNDRFSEWDYTYRFTKEKNSLGIKHLYVITTYNTASASESVINGLKPFIDVSLIGYPTNGKPVGMEGINFCNVQVNPITVIGVNANDEGEYFDGIDVDCRVEDDVLHSFGSIDEGMLKETLSYIKNGKCSSLAKEKRVEKRDRDEVIENKKIYQGFRAERGVL